MLEASPASADQVLGQIPPLNGTATVEKVAMCFAENQARNPWEPLHVDMQYPAEASTITTSAVRGIHPVVEAT